MSKRKHEQVTALSNNNNYDAILLNNKKIIILIGQNKDSEAIWVKSIYNELKTLLLTDPSTKKAKLEILSVESLSINVYSNVINDWHYVINRVPESSPSNIAKTATAILKYCDLLNISVFNNYESYLIGQNKLLHHGILSALSLTSPKSVLVRNIDTIKTIANQTKLKFPLLLKPNSGGYGRGILQFQTKDELMQFCDNNNNNNNKLFGNDGTALLQEFHGKLTGSTVYRIWTLNNCIQCGIKVERPRGGFGGACLSDTCGRTQTIVHALDVKKILDEKIINDILNIEKLCKADCCSVEFLFDQDNDGNDIMDKPIYFDVNMLSTLPTNLGINDNRIINAENIWDGSNWNHWYFFALEIFNKILRTLSKNEKKKEGRGLVL